MKRILCIVLCAVLLSVAFACVRTNVMPAMMKDANYGMNALKTLQKLENVFVGSSMFRQGVNGEMLSKEKGDSFVLAYNGNQPFLIYYEVKELLDSGVEIDTLFVDMYAYSLTASPSLSDVRVLQDNDMEFTFSVYKTMQEYGDADLMDLYEMTLTSNNEMFLSWPVSYPMINSRYKNGSNSSKTTGATKEKLAQLSLGFGETEPNQVQLDNLKKLIQLCQEKDTNIVFVETPKYSRMYDESNYVGIMEKYVAFLDEHNAKYIISQDTFDACGLAKHENRVVYSYDSQNASYFTDLIHLSSDGCENFTLILKDLIATNDL